MGIKASMMAVKARPHQRVPRSEEAEPASVEADCDHDREDVESDKVRVIMMLHRSTDPRSGGSAMDQAITRLSLCTQTHPKSLKHLREKTIVRFFSRSRRPS